MSGPKQIDFMTMSMKPVIDKISKTTAKLQAPRACQLTEKLGEKRNGLSSGKNGNLMQRVKNSSLLCHRHRVLRVG